MLSDRIEELARLYEAATPGEWFAKPNDLIGGWAVMNCDLTPAYADPKQGQWDVADFVTRPNAATIAALHNAFPQILPVLRAAVEWREAYRAGMRYTADVLDAAEDALVAAVEEAGK